MPQGWLAPGLQHRVDTCISRRKRLHRLAPVSALSVERVRFDMQLLENPEISGRLRKPGTRFRELRTALRLLRITDVPLNNAPSPVHGHGLRAPPSVASRNDWQRQSSILRNRSANLSGK
jgi:hypothetical protein